MLYCLLICLALLGAHQIQGYVSHHYFINEGSLKFYPNSTLNGRAIAPMSRAKRGVADLFTMIKCATGCDPISYKGYGCYCGLFGSGRPVDGIDRCCKMHDWCYDSVKCPITYLEYFVPYNWKCLYNKPFCALNRGESCASKLCECDLLFSECLRRFPCPERRALCESSRPRLFQNILMYLT